MITSVLFHFLGYLGAMNLQRNSISEYYIITKTRLYLLLFVLYWHIKSTFYFYIILYLYMGVVVVSAPFCFKTVCDTILVVPKLRTLISRKYAILFLTILVVPQLRTLISRKYAILFLTILVVLQLRTQISRKYEILFMTILVVPQLRTLISRKYAVLFWWSLT